MVHLLPLLFFWGAPFWEARQPRQWAEPELRQLINDSPWARTEGTRIFLASARPLREAEEQIRLRHTTRQVGEPEPEMEEYELFLRDNPGKHIVLAALLPRPEVLMEASESRAMEEESLLRVGRRKYKMVGHFPPTRSDPHLRLIFPRVDLSKVKTFSFELYLPGVERPYRMVEFFLNEMTYRGKLEY